MKKIYLIGGAMGVGKTTVAQAEYLLDYRGGFLVNDKASVLAF